jgi:hypothetical protein
MYPLDTDRGSLDSGAAASTLYITEPKYVFLDRASLALAHPRTVFVGASNVVVGFRQPEIAPLLPGVEVDNLAVGGSNITQMAQIVDLVQEIQGKAARDETTFVIGVWYGNFVENRFKWYTPERHAGDTDIDIERYRYGFFRRTEAGPVALVPPDHLALGVVLIHPYLVLDKLSRWLSRHAREAVFGPDRKPSRDALNAFVRSEAERVEYLKYWHQQMQVDGDIPDEQFIVLHDLIGRILATGSKVVLVDLPIPKWHETRSPYTASYARKRDELVSQFRGQPGFAYVEMKDKDGDLDFYDEVHPKPRMTPLWAADIASHLQQDLVNPTTVSAGAHAP